MIAQRRAAAKGNLQAEIANGSATGEHPDWRSDIDALSEMLKIEYAVELLIIFFAGG
jgi:hypothetical protein